MTGKEALQALERGGLRLSHVHGSHHYLRKPEVRETHEGLLAAGIESVYVEFPGQGRTAREGFDKSILFDFWLKHS